MARRCAAGMGKARIEDRRGWAWQGMARHGGAWLGMAGIKARRGRAWQGGAWQGMAGILGLYSQQQHLTRREIVNAFVLGKPTVPDVQKIIDEYKTYSDGDVFYHAKISEIIEVAETSQRFKTITAAWRKLLIKSKNVYMEVSRSVDGENVQRFFKVLRPSERITLSTSRQKSGIKKIAVGGDIALSTSDRDLDEGDRRTRDHAVRVAATVKMAVVEDKLRLRYDFK